MGIPLITIGITHYQASDTIHRAVASAFAQSWEPTQIIIVDDGSHAEHKTGLREVQKKYPSLQIIEQQANKGVAAARNEIIRHARGEFLAFFDDDDESLPDRLQKQYTRIVEYERRFSERQPVICHTARLQLYPDGTKRYEPTMGTKAGMVPGGEVVALRILTGKPQPDIFGSTATCSQMARLSLYRDIGGFDERFLRSEDTDFNIRAAMIGAHFAGIEEALVVQHMTLTAEKDLAQEQRYTMQLFNKHREFIQQHTSWQFCYDWIGCKYHFLRQERGQFLIKIWWLIFRHPLLTIKRLLWALPNISFNLKFGRFYHGKK